MYVHVFTWDRGFSAVLSVRREGSMSCDENVKKCTPYTYVLCIMLSSI